jgi:hypothetical protein
MKKYLLLLGLCCLANLGWAQQKKETITKTGRFANATGTRVLSVENVQGFVKVLATEGNQVELTAEKTISAKNQADVEKGMREVQLKFVESGDSIYVFLEAPFIYRRNGRNRNVNINSDDMEYDFNFDLTLKVPAAVNLLVATVNNGTVEVSNITGDIKARNVNGGIKLTGVAGRADVNTVNGGVDVQFARNPTADSKFRTINGDVRVHYAPQLNATVSFKSMNGQFYSDLPDMELMPVQVIKNQGDRGNGTVYKIDKMQSYKIGKGGVALSFETLNGNMYLQKK